MVPEPTQKATVTERAQQPVRLVKAWLPVDLVRRLDRTILDSNGAYADRTEFLVEAINDRLTEEDASTGGTVEMRDGPVLEATVPVSTSARVGNGQPFNDEVAAVRLGDWLNADTTPTLPRTEGPAFNFGLHNRDLPTLWAFDWLGRLVSRAGHPIPWRQFDADVLPRAWAMGRALRAQDLSGQYPLKAAAGFPMNLKKREATERRFMTHFVAAMGGNGPIGPLVVFGMIGSEVRDELEVAPSPEGIKLFKALISAGIDRRPPFPPAAWPVLAVHLRNHAPEELRGWLRVLNLVAGRPARSELVAGCTWWSGSTADTNAMSYVARGREWGLVESKLDNGCYQLTTFGQEAIQEEETV